MKTINSTFFPSGGLALLVLLVCHLAPAASNDFFTNRLEITTPTYHFDGSLYGATAEPGEPLPPGTTQTLWWKFLPPEDCKLNLAASATLFTPVLRVYEGTNFPLMSLVNPVSGSIYRLQYGKEYSVQLASGNVPDVGVSLDARFYSMTNDMFAGSTHLDGTNVTFYGNFTGATLEPGEPVPAATNTIWACWAASFTGRARFFLNGAPFCPQCNIYTGPTLDRLQPVRVVVNLSVSSFLAVEGTVYQFQFSGCGDSFTFSLALDPLPPGTNDNFADAEIVRGNGFYFGPRSVTGATMELGEPAHMGPVPQKSLWWKWQAPVSGTLYLGTTASLVPTVMLAVYSGDAVEALTLGGKATNSLEVPVIGGQTYHIAGVVETNAIGDIMGYAQGPSYCATSRVMAGNLLQEPSWEGTGVVDAKYWHWSGGLSGYVDEFGGADGTTWPSPGTGTTIWQDIPTVLGHQYTIRFAYMVGGGLSGCCGDAHLQVGWDTNILGFAYIPAAESGFWHWTELVATASNTTSRVSFKNLAREIDLDAFSVVDLSAPPLIVNQPDSISTISGGTAEFIVGATGTAPLQYQWFFNNVSLAGQTNHLLVLESVSTNQAGTYSVTVTNAFGSASSAPVMLSVDAPVYPTIVWQPYGDTVAPGAYFSFEVAAIGTLPLQYQWYFNGASLSGATNKSLRLTSVSTNDGGVYQVTIRNTAGIVWSLPASLRINDAVLGGGQVVFGNRTFCGTTNPPAPIFDMDGVTPLNGSAFQAQLYAGPSLELLRPAGRPVPFLTGFDAGYIASQVLTLPNVPPGSNFVAQVRAWDSTKGDAYEETRALGGRFGKSELLALTAGGDGSPPRCLDGLQSFSLQAGLPQFTVGIIQFVERQPHNTVVWAVTGQAGFRYLIEKADHDFVWRPFTVLTNVTGTATFTDSATSGSAVTFYRARILD